jgi:hypothetical protein
LFFFFTCICSFSSLFNNKESSFDIKDTHIGTGICRLRRSKILSRKSHPFATNNGRVINVSNNCSRLDFDRICSARTIGVNFPSVSVLIDFFSSSLFDENRLDNDNPKIEIEIFQL